MRKKVHLSKDSAEHLTSLRARWRKRNPQKRMRKDPLAGSRRISESDGSQRERNFPKWKEYYTEVKEYIA